MFLKKQVDAYEFGPFLVGEFVRYAGSAAARISKEHRPLSEHELHTFLSSWLTACAGLIGAATKDETIRMCVLSSYVLEVGSTARKGGFDFKPEEVLHDGSTDFAKYLVSDGYGEVCADACQKIVITTLSGEINGSKARDLATRFMISDFGACHRLILFWMQRLRVIPLQYRRSIAGR